MLPLYEVEAYSEAEAVQAIMAYERMRASLDKVQESLSPERNNHSKLRFEHHLGLHTRRSDGIIHELGFAGIWAFLLDGGTPVRRKLS